MLSYSKDLDFDLIVPDLRAVNREQIYRHCAQEVVKSFGGVVGSAFKRLVAERRLAPASVGGGLAVSDLKVRGLGAPFMVLVTLDRDVDFNAPDGMAVNLYCIVLSPESDGACHLRRLSRVSRFLRDQSLQKKVCEVHSAGAIRALLSDPDGWMLAA